MNGTNIGPDSSIKVGNPKTDGRQKFHGSKNTWLFGLIYSTLLVLELDVVGYET